MAGTSRRQTAVKPDEGMEVCEEVQAPWRRWLGGVSKMRLSSVLNEEVEVPRVGGGIFSPRNETSRKA